MKKFKNLVSVVLFVTLIGCSTPSSAPQTARQTVLQAETISISSKNIGYIVYDIQSREVILEQNADQHFIPASTGKIPTILAALSILGPDHRFKTRLTTDGIQQGSILNGNLYLVGGGDPLLTLPNIMTLAESLKARGISKVTGHFYFDESLYISQPAIDLEIDQDASYNPGMSALSSEFNQFYLNSNSRSIWTTPSMDFLKVTESERPGPSFQYQKGLNSEKWLMTNLNASKKLNKTKLPVKQSGLYTSFLLKEMLVLEGVLISTPKPGEPGRLPKRVQELAHITSEPLLVLAEKTLEYSNNLMAELILMAAARKLSGKALTQTEAAMEISKWINYNVPLKTPDKIQEKYQLNTLEPFLIRSGSGDSLPVVTPRQFLTLLKWGHKKRFNGRSLMSLFPISGWKGSMSDRLTGPSTSLRVWAKTGTMSFGIGLAGYFYSQSGKKYLFSIFCSDLEKRRIYNDLHRQYWNSSLGDGPQEGSGTKLSEISEQGTQWISQARTLIDGHLEKWIKEN